MAPDAQQQALQQVLAEAAARLDAGDAPAAFAVIGARGGVALRNPVGQNILGEIHLALNRPAEALGAFDAALRLAPAFAEAHANRGAALIDLGRPAEALDAERRALAARPDLALAHFNSGIALRALRRPEEAIGAFGAMLGQRPDHPEALRHRGAARLEADRPLEALADFRRVAALQPGDAANYVGIASAYRALGQVEPALLALDHALTLAPGDTTALALRSSLRAAHSAGAEPPLTSASSVPFRLTPFAAALAAADAAVARSPADASAHLARAQALSELGRVEEAQAALLAAGRLGALGGDYHHLRAVLLTDLGDLDEAEADHRRALALQPDEPGYHTHYGMHLLAKGAFAQGWSEHEWRLRNPAYAALERHASSPRWAGEDLAGKKILVLNEQGHGDTIQFARLVPALCERGGTVTLLVVRPLMSLLGRSLPGVHVTDTAAGGSSFDYHVALMSLPHWLGTGLADLPGPMPYVVPDPALMDKWRRRLGSDGCKVGVAWRGQPEYFRNNDRSVPLAAFAPLAAMEGVRLISIQALNGLDQLQRLPAGMKVESYGHEIAANPDGFEEIAALMANLDLVVSSDTVTAHLAGALGRPTWVALRDRPDWRWLRDRADSPWYPTMRLFRQKQRGDWAGVFGEISVALAAWIGAPSG